VLVGKGEIVKYIEYEIVVLLVAMKFVREYYHEERNQT
jgi:hypothetical protein